MTAPLVPVTQTSNGTGSATFPVELPTSTIEAGDSIYVALATSDVTHTAPSGSWTTVKSYQDASFSRTSLFRLIATGTESGTTVNFTGGSSAPFAAVSLHVTGAAAVAVASAGVDGASNTVTPDEVTATWTGGDNLFMAITGYIDDDEDVALYPVLYVHTQDDVQSGGGTNAGVGLAVATRRYKADFDTPVPDFVLTGSEGWAAFTVVVRPAYEAQGVPTGPAGLSVEMRFEADWVDIGEDAVYHRDGISIRQGRSDWASEAEPSSCRLTLDNRTGAWSPDYDTGLYAGLFKRNVPLRVGIQGDTGIESATGVDAAFMSTPHDSADILAGDFDIRVEFQLSAQPAEDAFHALVYKADTSSNGWALHIGVNNTRPDIRFIYYQPDTTQRVAFQSSGDGIPMPDWLLWRRAAIRVTLDESTGDVEFLYSTSIDGTWVSAGVHNPAGGASSIDFPTTDIVLGRDFFGANLLQGRLHALQLADGIDGTEVADLDLRGATPAASSVVGTDGRTWTVQPDGRLSAVEWRFHGEIASLPVEWALKGDQWAPIEAAGLLRRLRHWDDILQSPLRRGLERGALSADIHSYWPMEEKGDSTLSRLSNAAAVQQWVLKAGSPDPASSTDFVASDAILTLKDSRWHVVVDPGEITGDWMVRFLLSVPASIPGDVELLHIVTGDLEYRLIIQNTGSAFLRTYREGAVVHTGSSFGFGLLGVPKRISISVETNGTGVDGGILGQEPGGVTGGGGNTFATASASYPTFIRMNQNQDAGDIAIGHMTVESVVRTDGFDDELDGFSGESAGARIQRLCSEEGVAVTTYGAIVDTVALGPQGIKSFVGLLQEAASTDLGILFDRPDGLGLGYRSGRSIGAQDAQFTIDYDAGDALGTPVLQRDDQGFANDVTVTNWDKTTARAELTNGAYSTSEPPDGAGRYVAGYDVSVDDPTSLVDHVQTRLRLGSVDVPRVVGLTLATHIPGVTEADKVAILGLIPGDKLGLVDLPATAHPEGLDQILQGWTEQITSHTHTLDVNTTPAEPWDPGVLGQDGDLRYDTPFSYLASGVPAGATTLYVVSDLVLWTTSGGDLPFDVSIGGARVTVTAISGTTSPQVFTVDAVSRDLAGGSDVRLADPAYYSL